MERRPSGVFLSPRNNCSQGSIWNLNRGEMVFVINNQIFEPLKYLCPFLPPVGKYCTGVLFWWWWSERAGGALRTKKNKIKNIRRRKAGGETKAIHQELWIYIKALTYQNRYIDQRSIRAFSAALVFASRVGVMSYRDAWRKWKEW